jgi:hypothetical protein
MHVADDILLGNRIGCRGWQAKRLPYKFKRD